MVRLVGGQQTAETITFYPFCFSFTAQREIAATAHRLRGLSPSSAPISPLPLSISFTSALTAFAGPVFNILSVELCLLFPLVVVFFFF